MKFCSIIIISAQVDRNAFVSAVSFLKLSKSQAKEKITGEQRRKKSGEGKKRKVSNGEDYACVVEHDVAKRDTTGLQTQIMHCRFDRRSAREVPPSKIFKKITVLIELPIKITTDSSR